MSNLKPNFSWINFYVEFANNLLKYKDNRDNLLEFIEELSKTFGSTYLEKDKYDDGTTGFLRDICPFTTMGMFNRAITSDNRIEIAKKFKEFLDIKTASPVSFDGIPILNNQKSWFFSYEESRGADDINKLWNVFEQAIRYEKFGNNKKEFCDAYDAALPINGVGWNLSIGLFWIRPNFFLPLDEQTRNYLKKLSEDKLENLVLSQEELKKLKSNGSKKFSAENYLELVNKLKDKYSFCKLSYDAWKESKEFSNNKKNVSKDKNDSVPQADTQNGQDEVGMDKREKNFPLNQILYGPPGTGKTYHTIIKALSILENQDYEKAIEEKKITYEELKNRFDTYRKVGQIEFITFHQSYSYEDFVEGIKPNIEWGNASNELSYIGQDGIFKDICMRAKKLIKQSYSLTKKNNVGNAKPYVLIIDEINRGDVSKIFGELITLIEEDKRLGNEHALTVTLPYSKEKFGVPKNLYIIGTMNTADRSIALLDTALRRRFAFEEMMPKPELLRTELEDINDINLQDLLTQINTRITENFDKDHQIGHAYFININNKRELTAAYKNKLLPLLNEYFYNDADSVAKILNCTKSRIEKAVNDDHIVEILYQTEKQDSENE